MKISYSLSVEKGTNLNSSVDFISAGILEMCTNEKPAYPYHLTSGPELINIRADFTINDDYMVCNLYNLIQHWINPEDHILVHNEYLVPQLKGNTFNTQTVTDFGIQDGDTIHSNRIYETWNLGKIRLGTLYENKTQYFVRPDNGIIQIPSGFPVPKTLSVREKWEPTFRNIKYLYEISVKIGDTKIVEQLQPLVDELNEL